MSLIIKSLKLLVISVVLSVLIFGALFFLYPSAPGGDTKFGVTFSRVQAEGFGNVEGRSA